MGDYKGVDCPICHRSLQEQSTVVICPDCGAPYHKACIEQRGACIFDDLHQQNKTWKRPSLSQNEQLAADDTKKCPQCGAENPAGGLFCEGCGMPWSNNVHTEDVPKGQSRQEGNLQDEDTPGWGFRVPPQQMAHHAFAMPFGGLYPEEEIDGVSVKDLAMFVGQNIAYFLPKFKAYCEQKAMMSFNFAAAIFQGFYLFYRKMYLMGFIVFLATTVLSIPQLLLTLDQSRVYLISPDVEPWFAEHALDDLINICSTVSLMVRILVGFFTNKIYKSHCIEKIRQIQKQKQSPNEYVISLTKHGSVSMRFVMLVIGFYILVSYAAYVAMFFILR